MSVYTAHFAMTNKVQKEKEKFASIESLMGSLKPSDKLIIFVTTVSRNGMSRRMKVYKCTEKGLSNLTYHVARACELPENDNGVRVGGCGMDMVFWLANQITHAIGYRDEKDLQGNGGTCLAWQAIY